MADPAAGAGLRDRCPLFGAQGSDGHMKRTDRRGEVLVAGDDRAEESGDGRHSPRRG